MTEVFHLDRWTRLLGTFCGAFMLLALAACGGGGTGSTSPNTPTGDLIVNPSSIAIEYGTAPVTIVVSGGVKPYALTSSLQSLIPVGGVGDDGRFSITPAYAPDIATLVTLTIRDAAQTTRTVSVNVAARPGANLPLAISPNTARTIFGVPVLFQISGGRAPYSVVSSFPTIIASPVVAANGRLTV